LDTGWIHKHRVELYEQIAVHGALQSTDELRDPLLTGTGLLQSPVDQLDQTRESEKKQPLLYPDIRKDDRGEVGLFQADLPEELCWPAEFAYGLRRTDEREVDDESLQTIGFSSDPEDVLIDRSQEDVVEDLTPWLDAVAEWAGIPDATVRAAPSRPFLLAIDREEHLLYLNPSFLPMIVAAASNQNRHVPSSVPAMAGATPGTDTTSPPGSSSVAAARDSSAAGSESKVLIPASLPRIDGAVTPDRAAQALSDYQEFATSNPPAYVSSPLNWDAGNEPDSACGCASDSCDYGYCYTKSCDCENACSYGCDDSKCDGYAVWCNKDLDKDPTCDEECSQGGKASAGHAARSLFLLLLPVLLFWRWGRKPGKRPTEM